MCVYVRICLCACWCACACLVGVYVCVRMCVHARMQAHAGVYKLMFICIVYVRLFVYMDKD